MLNAPQKNTTVQVNIMYEYEYEYCNYKYEYYYLVIIHSHLSHSKRNQLNIHTNCPIVFQRIIEITFDGLISNRLLRYPDFLLDWRYFILSYRIEFATILKKSLLQ